MSTTTAHIYKVKNKSSGLSINGLTEGFPLELIGIIPVKQYMEVIDIINYHSIRKFKMKIKKHFIVSIFTILPLFILPFIDLYLWSVFRKKVKNELIPIIDDINSKLSIISVVFKVDVSIFGNISLKLLYNDINSKYKKELVPTKQITIDGFKKEFLLLESFSSRLPSLKNKFAVHKYKNKNERSYLFSFRDDIFGDLKKNEVDKKKLIIKANNISYFRKDFQGLSYKYQVGLYNYLSYKEFCEMIDEYNSFKQYDSFDTVCLVLYTVLAFLSITIVGLIFWAMFTWEWYAKEHSRYAESLKNYRQLLNKKYNGLYGQRGIFICDNPKEKSLGTTKISDSKGVRFYSLYSYQTDLFIFVDRDIGDGPVLTRLLPSKKLLIAPTVGDNITPKYDNSSSSTKTKESFNELLNITTL